MKLLGIIHAYNEDDCIENAIECLLNSAHDVHVFDHGSSDNTADKVRSYGNVKYHYLDREKIHFFRGRNNLYTVISQFIGSKVNDFDWVTWMDADEILHGANGMDLAKSIHKDFARGSKVIRGTIHEYWITEKDDFSQENYLDRLKHYRVRPPQTAGGICRGWAIELTREMQRGRHRKTWNGVISDWEYVLKHYPIRTLEQGKRKIMKERNWQSKGDGTHYKVYRENECNNLIKQSRQLIKETSK